MNFVIKKWLYYTINILDKLCILAFYKYIQKFVFYKVYMTAFLYPQRGAYVKISIYSKLYSEMNSIILLFPGKNEW